MKSLNKILSAVLVTLLLATVICLTVFINAEAVNTFTVTAGDQYGSVKAEDTTVTVTTCFDVGSQYGFVGGDFTVTLPDVANQINAVTAKNATALDGTNVDVSKVDIKLKDNAVRFIVDNAATSCKTITLDIVLNITSSLEIGKEYQVSVTANTDDFKDDHTYNDEIAFDTATKTGKFHIHNQEGVVSDGLNGHKAQCTVCKCAIGEAQDHEFGSDIICDICDWECTHDYAELRVEQQRDCVNDELKTFECKLCKTLDENRKTASATGHNFSAVQPAVSPKCNQDGTLSYKWCANCNLNFAPDAQIDAPFEKQLDNIIDTNRPGHSSTGEWLSDQNGHYRLCDSCGVERCDEGAHNELGFAPNGALGHKKACSICKYAQGSDINHDFGNDSICDNCNWECTEHTDNEGVVNTTAGCLTNETRDFTCQICGRVEQNREVPNTAKGHTFGDLVPAVSGDCSHTGTLAYKTCTLCNNNYSQAAGKYETEPLTDLDDKTLVPTIHLNMTYRDIVPSDCTNTGKSAHYECDNCHKTFVDNVETDVTIAAKGHKFGDITKANAGNCSAYGTVAYKTCTVCKKNFKDTAGDFEEVALETLSDNTYVSTTHLSKSRKSAVAPTCTADGTKLHWECNYCHAKLDADGIEIDVTVPKKGHTFGDVILGSAGDCTTPGTADHKHCSVCNKDFKGDAGNYEENELLTFETDIDPTNHKSTTYHQEVPAGCTTPGTKAYDQCNACGKKLIGGQEVSDVTIDAKGHTFDATGKCTVCDYQCEHSPGADWYNDNPNGHYKRCTECNAVVDLTAHWGLQDQGEAGHITVCTVCEYSSSTPVPHTYDSADGVCPCGYACQHNNGYQDGTGSGDVISKGDCTTNREVKQYCKICGKQSAENHITEAVGHTFGAVKNAVAGTCKSAGTIAYKTCTVCKLNFEANADKMSNDNKTTLSDGKLVPTNHKNKTHYNAVAAGCLTTGKIAYDKCNDCGKLLVNNTPVTNVTVAAAGHKFGAVKAAVAGNCKTAGTVAYKTCSVCKKNFAQNAAASEKNALTSLKAAINPNAHKLTSVAKIPAKEGVAGVLAHQRCTVCGKKFINGVQKTDAQLKIAALPVKPKYVEGWQGGGSSWWYQYSDGSYAVGWKSIDGAWYYFDTSGWMQTGWVNDGGTWYYMSDSGAMATGWVNDSGTWYYMSGSGAMAIGWVNDGGAWYYMSGSGAMATGWVNDGGTWYYMNASGTMATGWVLDSGVWYWLEPSGVWTGYSELA